MDTGEASDPLAAAGVYSGWNAGAGRQAGQTSDCGPLSLWAVCVAAGHEYDLDSIKVKAEVSEQGTTLLNLKAAAEAVGFNADGVRVEYSDLLAFLRGAGLPHYISINSLEDLE